MIRETLNERDVQHRIEFARYATEDAASDWHRTLLDRLYGLWDSINGDHFRGVCIKPHILLAEPKTPRALGDHAPVSGWGSKNQIRLRPSLLDGTHKLLRPGDVFAEGRMRYVEDVLLHESVHQYCDEALHADEKSYKGHGPVFAGECNRIGEALGLAPVRPAKARGKLKDRPSCAQWPHNVRPADYYLGALADPARDQEDDDGDDEEARTFPCPYDPERAAAVFAAHMTAAAIGLFGARLAEITGLAIGTSPDTPDGEAPEETRPDDAEDPHRWPAPARSAETVSANGDGRPVSANGDDHSPYVALAKGQRVRFCGTGKPRHATTGTIESVHDGRGYFDRVAGRWISGGYGAVQYQVLWDDGTRNGKRVLPDKRPTIEALEPELADEDLGRRGDR